MEDSKKTRHPNAPLLILAARNRNPNATAAAIAREIGGGITRARVSQLLAEMGLETRVTFKRSHGSALDINLIAEMAVVHNLVARGFEVYRSISSSHSKFDIIASTRSGELIKIDVRAERFGGKYPSGIDSAFDYIAYVSPTGKISYKPELDQLLVDMVK